MPNISRRIGLLVGFLGIPRSFRGLRSLAVNAQYPQKIEPSAAKERGVALGNPKLSKARHLFAALAEKERAMISHRTKAALAAE
jgi:hypothetical protein